MKISVIVPVYNVEHYLYQCLDSLLKQTYTPYEIVLVDDGSTDSSGSVCEEYSQKYSYIKTIHKNNQGLGFARNTGIENATGDWVVFLDSDDFFEKDLLKVLVDIQKKTGADTVIGGYKRVDSKGNIYTGLDYQDMSFRGKQVREILLPRILGSSPEKSDAISMSVCNCLFNLKIIKENNLKFPSERVVISEDIFFNYDYYLHSCHVEMTSKSKYIYRITEGSLTHKYREDRFILAKRLFCEMEKKIDKDEMGEVCKIRLMRSMFNYWRMCLSQEQKKISNKTSKEIIKSINNICNDKCTIEILQGYPMRKLKFKQKMFLIMVKYKLFFILYIFVQMGYF